MKISVFCTTSFEGFHCWPDAPEEVEFLRDVHRHRFHVTAYKAVSHDDRDVEFILLQRKLNDQIHLISMNEDTTNWSCERWAIELINRLGLSKCIVSEDKENGAVVEVEV